MERKSDWIWRSVMTLMLTVIGYQINRQLEAQRMFNDSINARVATLELFVVETRSSRFTSNDWMHGKENLDLAIGANEKRLTKVEDAMTRLTEYLPRIEKKLDGMR